MNRSAVPRLLLASSLLYGCGGDVLGAGAAEDDVVVGREDHDPGATDDPAACVAGARPPVLRRLNARELRRTLRDLLGVDVALDLPADGRAGGFDTVGDALTVSAVFLERYEAALDRVVAAALARPEVDVPAAVVEIEDVAPSFGWPIELADAAGSGWWAVWTSDPVEVPFSVEVDGVHRLSARGVWAAGSAFGNPTPRVAVTVDGAPVATFELVDPYAPPERSWTAELPLAAGDHVLGLVYTNPDAHLDWDVSFGTFRILSAHGDVIAWDRVEVAGPLPPPSADPAPRAALLSCAPAAGEDPAICARAVLGPFVARAWRRPVADDEVDRLVAVFAASRAAGSAFDVAIGDAVHAALLSPSFLLRVEEAPTAGEVAVDDHVLAERLSFFLWSSAPDAGLRALADAGLLHEPEILAAEAERLLDDPRSDALVEGFGRSWLALAALDAPTLDPVAYPALTDDLRGAMREETERLFDRFLHDPTRPVEALLDPGEAWLSASLAAHYGLPAPAGGVPGWVSTVGTPRGGLLGQGSLHVATAHPTRSSPVERGAFVLARLLCRDPGAPPPGVAALDEGTASASPRDALAAHAASPACAGCHGWLDPIGLALEPFDADGSLRDAWPDGTPIDGVDRLPDGTEVAGPEGLAERIAGDPAFARCVARQLATYATGRVAEPAACALDDVVETARARGGSLPALVAALVASPWMMRQDPEDGP